MANWISMELSSNWISIRIRIWKVYLQSHKHLIILWLAKVHLWSNKWSNSHCNCRKHSNIRIQMGLVSSNHNLELWSTRTNLSYQAWQILPLQFQSPEYKIEASRIPLSSNVSSICYKNSRCPHRTRTCINCKNVTKINWCLCLLLSVLSPPIRTILRRMSYSTSSCSHRDSLSKLPNRSNCWKVLGQITIWLLRRTT